MLSLTGFGPGRIVYSINSQSQTAAIETNSCTPLVLVIITYSKTINKGKFLLVLMIP